MLLGHVKRRGNAAALFLVIPMFRNMYADAESLIAKAVPKLLADTS